MPAILGDLARSCVIAIPWPALHDLGAQLDDMMHILSIPADLPDPVYPGLDLTRLMGVDLGSEDPVPSALC